MLVVAAALTFLIGGVLGMLGGGGSVLVLPVLLYVLGLEPKAALLTSQVLLAVASAVAVTVHIRAGRVSFSTGLLFGAASMFGAYLGGRAACYVPAQLLLLGFTGLMLLSAFQMLRGRRAGAAAGKTAPPGRRGLPWRGSAVGFPTGVVAGLLGVGGGFMIVPALILIAGLPIERAVGTSLLIIALQSTAGAAGYMRHASADAQMVGVLAIAMASGSVCGGLLSQRLPGTLLRRLFAILLLAIALLMLIRNLW